MEGIKPRRGRKPKNSIVKSKVINEKKDTPIITHLPITLNNDEDNINDIFVKDETISNSNSSEIKRLKKEIKDLKKELNNKVIDSDMVYNIDDKECNKSKCWWCRHSYCTPTVTLPENIFKGTFQTFGHFCSYNCALAYSIDLNDENIHKRSSLLHYLYKQTYNESKEIIKSPDWRVLQEYGGVISIDEYRNNFILNNYDYQYIKPPLISRTYQIEKSSKNKVVKKQSEFVLKRSKPLNTSKYTLETTMGLKKIVNVSSE